MGIHKDYETLADNLCDIHFLYSRDLSNVFEQHSTRGEEAALFWLSRLENPVSAGELASKLGITSGRIANILGSLDRKKFIERHRSSRDRRQINVTLTDAGAEHIRSVYENARKSHMALLQKMGDDNAAEFIRLMNLAIRTASEIAGT
jgi:DNA-binding MarR family transcriptional regulator